MAGVQFCCHHTSYPMETKPLPAATKNTPPLCGGIREGRWKGLMLRSIIDATADFPWWWNINVIISEFLKFDVPPWIHRCIEGKLWKYFIADGYAQRERFPHQSSSTQKLIIEATLVLECAVEGYWTHSPMNVFGPYMGVMSRGWKKWPMALWVGNIEAVQHVARKVRGTGPPQLASYNASKFTIQNRSGSAAPWEYLDALLVHKNMAMFHQHLFVEFICE